MFTPGKLPGSVINTFSLSHLAELKRTQVIEKLSYPKMAFENEGPLAKRIKVSSHSQGEDTGKLSQ